jgi:hypothetical protein
MHLPRMSLRVLRRAGAPSPRQNNKLQWHGYDYARQLRINQRLVATFRVTSSIAIVMIHSDLSCAIYQAWYTMCRGQQDVPRGLLPRYIALYTLHTVFHPAQPGMPCTSCSGCLMAYQATRPIVGSHHAVSNRIRLGASGSATRATQVGLNGVSQQFKSKTSNGTSRDYADDSTG